MDFHKYPKVRPVASKETQGIFEGKIHVFEKLDGSNVQIGKSDGELFLGSRSRFLTEQDKQFSAFWDWAQAKREFKEWDFQNGELILYGEWLKKHTVNYHEHCYANFYLFDVFNFGLGEFLEWEEVDAIGDQLDVNIIPTFYVGEFKSLESLEYFVGKSNYAVDQGEGIVIKNYGFRNRYDRPCHAKIVAEQFSEEFTDKCKQEKQDAQAQKAQNAINKVFSNFVTEARVRKNWLKWKNGETDVDTEWEGDMRDMRRLPGLVYEDLVEEAGLDIIRKYPQVKWTDIRAKMPGYIALQLKDIIDEAFKFSLDSKKHYVATDLQRKDVERDPRPTLK